MVIEAQYINATIFQDGLAPVQSTENKRKWGYINVEGEFEIEPKFEMASYFSEGVAPVYIGDELAGEWSYIDQKGNIVFTLPEEYSYPGSFSEGLATFVWEEKEGEGAFGYLDKKGDVVIDPILLMDMNSKEMAPVKTGLSMILNGVILIKKAI